MSNNIVGMLKVTSFLQIGLHGKVIESKSVVDIT